MQIFEMATKTKLSVDQESNLIDAVRERKPLFDKRVEGYHKNKSLIWEQLAVQLNWEGLNGEEVQKLWQNLRNQYMAHRRKLRRPSGSAKGNRPYFRHEEAMSFLNDSLGEETTYTNLQSMNDEPENEGETVKDKENEPNHGQQNDLVQGPYSSDSDHRSHTKFNSKRKLDVFDESLLKLLKTENKDEFCTFGDLVAVKLRKIGEKDQRLAAEIQHQLLNTIHEAEIQLL